MDVVGGSGVACLDQNLARACLNALAIPRASCRDFAMTRSWSGATEAFLANLVCANGELAATAA
jgi:hypothetical protein